MTASPRSDMKLHTYQEAQTVSRVRNGMMKTYFVLWGSKLQFGGAGEEKRGGSGEAFGVWVYKQ